MTFIVAVTLKIMPDILRKITLITAQVFMNLHNQRAIIYDDKFIIRESVGKMNEAYKTFNVQYPEMIPR